VKRTPRTKPKSPYTWRQAPDEVLLAHLPDSHSLDRAESICPTASTVERAAAGEKVARAIIDAWKPKFEVTYGEVPSWR
jgi:hypothetical protein